MSFIQRFIVSFIANLVMWFGGFCVGMLICSFIVWEAPVWAIPGSYARIGVVWSLVMALYLSRRKNK